MSTFKTHTVRIAITMQLGTDSGDIPVTIKRIVTPVRVYSRDVREFIDIMAAMGDAMYPIPPPRIGA